MEENDNKVKIGIVACASNASNTGRLASLVSVELINALGDVAGICSLPAIATKVVRQTNLVKSIPALVLIDGCHNECAKKILSNVGIKPSIYVNLEYDFGLKKEGPFTTFNYKESDVKAIVCDILEKIKKEVSDV
ncbi:MAG: putative zinc-binding protein [Caldisericum sp.]|uniref:putative zinc-binding protein n=1 Tax=Caldisericum sp. TaxID=2499687 RepID=UPI003D0B85EC